MRWLTGRAWRSATRQLVCGLAPWPVCHCCTQPPRARSYSEPQEATPVASHKRKRPKHRRAGCLLCKPSKLTPNVGMNRAKARRERLEERGWSRGLGGREMLVQKRVRPRYRTLVQGRPALGCELRDI